VPAIATGRRAFGVDGTAEKPGKVVKRTHLARIHATLA
jgi:hypothetical protein